jgi:acyl-CoA dehydrogenase
MKPDLAHLAWPFFDEAHRRFAESCRPGPRARSDRLPITTMPMAACAGSCAPSAMPAGSRRWCRRRMAALHAALDVRSLCLAREILGWHDGLADFSFAMQGLGSYPITAFGSDALKSKYLPPVAAGSHIAAFALSEPRSGSDVANIDMTAKPDGANHVRLDGEKPGSRMAALPIIMWFSRAAARRRARGACRPLSSTPIRRA